MRVVCLFLVWTLLVVGLPGIAVEAMEDDLADLAEMDIEQLLDLDVVVTSVSRKEEKLNQTPSAVYVLTNEDLRRAGVTSIPDALRLVPGVHVAQIDAHNWSISVRGFSSTFSDKLLVMIDGRSVYTPFFAGVYWDAQNVPIEDVERIEVIRGPGATVWGANAVNGVINIITKSAKDTQGGLVSSIVGTEQDQHYLRYGMQLPEGANLRLWGLLKDIDPQVYPDARRADDEWQIGKLGMRLDWDLTPDESLTLSGEYYNGNLFEWDRFPTFVPPYSFERKNHIDISGGHVLFRYDRKLGEDSDFSLQTYYDRTLRDQQDWYREVRDTVDVETVHRFQLTDRQEIVWGLGFRYTTNRLDGSMYLRTRDRSHGDDLYSAFVQDTLTLIEDRLKLTIGSKFEYNNYTGFEVQPNLRLVSTPDDRNTTWLAISRAVKTPSVGQADSRILFLTTPNPMDPNGLPFGLALIGNDDYDSEELIAYEIGHRFQYSESLAFDIAGFVNDYDKLRNNVAGTPFFENNPAPPHLIVPLSFTNTLKGRTYGVELASDYNVTESWRLRFSYTFLKMNLHDTGLMPGMGGEVAELQSPQNQFQIGSYWNLPGNWQFDTCLYYVDSLPDYNIPSYTRMDTRLGWTPNDCLDFSLCLQNVLDDRHPEYGRDSYNQPTEVQHSLYGRITYRF